MKGYQITFFTRQDRKHGGTPIGEWLMQVAMELKLPGATLMSAAEGFGKSRRIHSAHFFEFADQPLEILITANEEQAATLFARLAAAKIRLFYVKTSVEFGVLGDPGADG